MLIKSVCRASFATAVLLLVATNVNAQLVAILDQGYNQLFPHRGSSKFTIQHCFSHFDEFVRGGGNAALGDNGVSLSTYRVSLCNNGQTSHTFNFNAAIHPRNFVEPFAGQQLSTSSSLDHAMEISNGVWDFNSSVFQKHVQVFGLAGNLNPSGGSPDLLQSIAQNKHNYTTDRGFNVIRALTFINDFDTNTMGAIAISSVVFSRFSNGAIRTPPLCTSSPKAGQSVVNELRRKGIAVVAGLLNNDILNSTRTWPNCLTGVINVGRTDGFTPPNDGIGIGSNGIDFYTESAVPIPFRNYTAFGNSFAAPKVAAAFSILRVNFPNSTVDQQYRALQRSSTSTYNYATVTKPRIRRSQMNSALAQLQLIIQEDIDALQDGDLNVDPSEYGLVYGGSASDSVELPIKFAAAEAKESSGSLIEVSKTGAGDIQDVVIEFKAIFNELFNGNRKFRIRLNGTVIGTVGDFSRNLETLKSFVIDRDLLASSNNRVRIEPLSSTLKWGIKDLKATVMPKIPLKFGIIDTNQYGFSEEPLPRYTSAKFVFDVPVVEVDLKLTMTGYDQDFDNETEILINGKSIGFLNLSGNDQYGSPTIFSIKKGDLIVGTNQIEVFQKKLGLLQWRKWAVRDILLSEVRPDVAISSVAITTKNVLKNRPFEVVGSVTNVGGASAAATQVRYYLSDDQTITTDDLRLTKSSLLARLNSNISQNFISSFSTSMVNTGTYFGVCVDRVSLEVNFNNNCSAGVLLEGTEPAKVVPSIMLLLED